MCCRIGKLVLRFKLCGGDHCVLQSIFPFVKRASQVLLRSFLGRSNGSEVLTEAPCILRQETNHPPVVGRAHYQPDMPWFTNAIHDLGIVVLGSTRVFLTGQRYSNAAILFANGWENIGSLGRGEFESGPFAPNINARRRCDCVRRISTTDACCDFKKNKLIAVVLLRVSAANELSVRDTLLETETVQQLLV